MIDIIHSEAPPESGIIAEIHTLVGRFASLQATLKLGDRAFVGRYKELVSEKAWSLLKSGGWQGHIKPEEAVRRLQALQRRVEASSAYEESEYCARIPFVRAADREFMRLLSADKDRRGLIILAPEGVGKTWWASRMVNEDPARRFYVHVCSTWTNKPLHLLRGIAERIGASVESSPAAQQRSVIQKLQEIDSAVLFVDEGHNGGLAIWKILKDLIAMTSVRVVLMAFPTQFDQVRMASTASVAEARQFLRRCQKPIFEDYRGGCRTEDITAFLVNVAGFPAGADMTAVVQQIAPMVIRNGNLSLLADALTETRDESEKRGEAATLALYAEALRALCGQTAKTGGAR